MKTVTLQTQPYTWILAHLRDLHQGFLSAGYRKIVKKRRVKNAMARKSRKINRN